MADSIYSLNKVMLIGNVGREPEMRFTPSGVPTTSFSVATSRRRRSPDGEYTDVTDWHNVVTWEKLAERMNELLTKGSKVYVEGRIETRSWEGQDGQKRFRTEIIAQDVKLLSPRGQRGGGEMGDDMNGYGRQSDEPVPMNGRQRAPKPAYAAGGGDDEDGAEDLPF